MLISSRETGRWIIPKGWPMVRKAAHRAAVIEAHEEAGLTGRIAREPVGYYESWKRFSDHFRHVDVDVFPMEVRNVEESFKEAGQRRRIWMRREDAAQMVDEPGLSSIIAQFRPAS